MKKPLLALSAALGLSACGPELVDCPEGAEEVFKQIKIDARMVLEERPNKVRNEAKERFDKSLRVKPGQLLDTYISTEKACAILDQRFGHQESAAAYHNWNDNNDLIAWSPTHLQEAIDHHNHYSDLLAQYPGANPDDFCEPSNRFIVSRYQDDRAQKLNSAIHEAAHLNEEFDDIGDHDEMTKNDIENFFYHDGQAPDAVYAWGKGSEQALEKILDKDSNPEAISIETGHSTFISYENYDTPEDFKRAIIERHIERGMTPPAWDDIRVCVELLPQAD